MNIKRSPPNNQQAPEELQALARAFIVGFAWCLSDLLEDTSHLISKNNQPKNNEPEIIIDK